MCWPLHCNVILVERFMDLNPETFCTAARRALNMVAPLRVSLDNCFILDLVSLHWCSMIRLGIPLIRTYRYLPKENRTGALGQVILAFSVSLFFFFGGGGFCRPSGTFWLTHTKGKPVPLTLVHSYTHSPTFLLALQLHKLTHTTHRTRVW